MGLRNLKLGTLYKNPHNGVLWSQPTPGGLVYPQQKNEEYAAYPVPGTPFIEETGIYFSGCGHSVDYAKIFRDHDDMLDISAAVVCCPMCSYINYLIEPYELIFDPLINPLIIL